MKEMKIILKQDVPNLGEEGDVCTVARGYGRNYLLPQSIAVPFTRQNIALFEHKRDAIEKRKEEKREQAKSEKERLEGEELIINATAGDTGKLFGSVSNATIAEELEKRGYSIEKKRIDIVVEGNTIRMVGRYPIRVKLYGEEEANLEILVQDPDQPELLETEEIAEEEKKETSEKSVSAQTEDQEESTGTDSSNQDTQEAAADSSS